MYHRIYSEENLHHHDHDHHYCEHHHIHEVKITTPTIIKNIKSEDLGIEDFNIHQVILIKEIIHAGTQDLEEPDDVFLYEVAYDNLLTLWEEQNPEEINSSTHKKLVCHGRLFKVIAIGILVVQMFATFLVFK